MMSQFRHSRCLALLGTLIFTVSVFAQETRKEKREAAAERLVQGTVSDPEGKFINGAVVQLKDVRSMQVRSFITQQNGEYHFSGLKIDNDYQLKADHSGMTSGWKTLSVFDTRKTPIVNLKLEKKDPDKADKSEKKE